MPYERRTHSFVMSAHPLYTLAEVGLPIVALIGICRGEWWREFKYQEAKMRRFCGI